MSSIYLDILKDRLYTAKTDSVERRASQWVLLEILSALTRLMAPVLSFTAEEVWGYVKNKKSRPGGSPEATNVKSQKFEVEIQGSGESVFLSSFPVVDQRFVDTELEEQWKSLLQLRDEVNKALEIKRGEKFIGNPLEARVTLCLPEKFRTLHDNYRDFLPFFFLVSGVKISEEKLSPSYESGEIEGLRVRVERAEGSKCERCWNWSVKVGTFADEPGLCERCYPVVKS
jgi:isoleucyl-tRNA synthetase